VTSAPRTERSDWPDRIVCAACRLNRRPRAERLVVCARVFTLSGNHNHVVSSMRPNRRGARSRHLRHEAAAVHMADASGALTRRARHPRWSPRGPGPRHGRSAALFHGLSVRRRCRRWCSASGHAATWELVLGGFPGVAAGLMAAPVPRPGGLRRIQATLGQDIGEAIRQSPTSGPSPVHLISPQKKSQPAVRPCLRRQDR